MFCCFYSEGEGRSDGTTRVHVVHHNHAHERRALLYICIKAVRESPVIPRVGEKEVLMTDERENKKDCGRHARIKKVSASLWAEAQQCMRAHTLFKFFCSQVL